MTAFLHHEARGKDGPECRGTDLVDCQAALGKQLAGVRFGRCTEVIGHSLAGEFDSDAEVAVTGFRIQFAKFIGMAFQVGGDGFQDCFQFFDIDSQFGHYLLHCSRNGEKAGASSKVLNSSFNFSRLRDAPAISIEVAYSPI